MAFDNTQPTASDALSLTELDLYHLIMDYRTSLGLDAIPLSENLTATAGRHAADTLYNIWQAELILPERTNLHSWSDAPYYPDHSMAANMWEAPQRIGTDYPGYGFEISAAGYGDVLAALNGWESSDGHNAVIANEGIWSDIAWNAIGIGVEIDPGVGNYAGRIYHVWFGREDDPDGSAPIKGTAGGDEIRGTAFRDIIRGRGGDDALDGYAGRDKLLGGGGDDDLQGGGARDRLLGGRGDDDLNGQRGRDILNGGHGDDLLNGGGGEDRFVFSGRNFGQDTILDYDGDQIRIASPVESGAAEDLAQWITDVDGSAVYDYLGDGVNTITFQGVTAAELDLALFDFL